MAISSGFIKTSFTSINGSGDIAVAGVEVGDIVLSAWDDAQGDRLGNFTKVVTTAGYINKWSSSDQTGLNISIIVLRL